MDACPICLELPSSRAPPYRLACGHAVHSRCMLDWCVHSAQQHQGDMPRCPVCRADLAGDELVSHASDDDEDEDEDEEVALAPASPDGDLLHANEELPIWRRLRVFPAHRRLVRWTAQQLLARGRLKTAPAVLKRCAEQRGLLRQTLVEALRRRRGAGSGRAQGTVAEVLRSLKQLDAEVLQARRRLEQHAEAVIRRCQRAKTCHRFLEERPLPQPPWWR